MIDQDDLKHTVSVLVDNEPGVLARVIGLISGRGYNIDSLTVAEVDAEKHISRITIVTPGSEETVNKMISQLERLVPVKRAVNVTYEKRGIEREMALIKIVSAKTQLVKAKKLCKKYKYTVIDSTKKSYVFEVSALKKDIDQLLKKLQPLGLASVSRTGVVAMTKGSETFKQN